MFGRSPAFASAEELFEATRSLVSELRSGGDAFAADELEAGMRCLNGLTDGWALFLESIERVRVSNPLMPNQKARLENIRKDVHRIVYRR